MRHHICTVLAAAGITTLALLAAPTAAQASTVSNTVCAPIFGADGQTYQLCASEDMDSNGQGGILHYAQLTVVHGVWPYRADLSIRVRDMCTGKTYPFFSYGNTSRTAVAMSVGPYLRHGCYAMDGYASLGNSSRDVHQIVRLP